MATKQEIEAILDDIAKSFGSIISDADTPVVEKTAAFKALTSYYALRFKKEAPPEQPSDAPNFSRFEDDIAEADDGEVRSGRGRNGLPAGFKHSSA